MNVAHNLERVSRSDGGAVAVRYEETALTYRQLDTLANRAANAFARLGVRPADRVVLYLPNSPEWIVAYFGVQKCGAIAVAVNDQCRRFELEAILADCAPVAAVTNTELADHVPAASSLRTVVVVDGEPAGSGLGWAQMLAASTSQRATIDMGRDDPSAILYTSGTTGQPKGVTLSHGNVISNAATAGGHCGVKTGDGLLLFVPLSHCFGQNAILNTGIQAGATIVLHRRFAVDDVMVAIAAGKITKFYGAPTAYMRLLSADPDARLLARVPYYFSAAAPLPLPLEREWRERFGREIHQGYGLTETSPFATYNHATAYREGSVGTAIDGVAIDVIDQQGLHVATGELGEIVIRGPNVMVGYWNRPEETARAMSGSWFRSGDVGRMDSDGYVFVVDRLKEMINVSGFKVYPSEVEQVLRRHPAVAMAAVYGVPDSIRGEQVRAAIVLNGSPASTKNLESFCRANVAAYKVPVSFEFRESLPTSATGKLLKRVLVEEALAK